MTDKYQEMLLNEIEDVPDEYLPNLIRMVHVFKISITHKPVLESIRQGWQEALNEETELLENLWEDSSNNVH